MDPEIWGPKLWTLLHIILVKPTAQQVVYKRFFKYLQYLLPCSKCRKHYRYHIRILPFPENQSQNASWLIKIHNRVNKSLNKPQLKIKDAIAFWEAQSDGLANIHIKDIASYILRTYDSFKSTYAHKYFWKHLPELIPDNYPPFTLTLQQPPLETKTAYAHWIASIKVLI